MKSSMSFFLFLSCLVFSSFSYAATQTLTTYYPAPNGNYRNMAVTNSLRLAAPGNACATNGNDVYLANQGGALEVCDHTGVGAIVAAGLWTGNGTFLYPTQFNQKISIGTNAAALSTLDVNGYIHAAGTGALQPAVNSQGAYLSWNANASGEMDLINNQGAGTGGFAFMNTPAAGTPLTNVMQITGGGNIGIGVANPSASLHIVSTGEALRLQSSGANGATFFTGYKSSSLPTFAINNDPGPNLNFYGYDAAYFNFLTVAEGGSKNLNLAPGGGNVGIANVNPQAKLDIGTGGMALNRNWTYLAAGGDRNHAISNLLSFAGVDAEQFRYYAYLDLMPTNGFPNTIFDGGPDTVFNSDGNTYHNNGIININNGHMITPGAAPTQQLSINYNQIWKSITAGDPAMYLQYSNSGGAVIIGNPVNNNNNLNVYGSVQVSQNINANGTITAASDMRFKQNIVPLTGALSKIDGIRGVSFEWNRLAADSLGHKAGEKGIGMLAQELQKVYPQLVVPVHNGKQEYLAIDYEKFSAVLLQSVKELKGQVNDMQAQINELQDKVKELEKKK